MHPRYKQSRSRQASVFTEQHAAELRVDSVATPKPFEHQLVNDDQLPLKNSRIQVGNISNIQTGQSL